MPFGKRTKAAGWVLGTIFELGSCRTPLDSLTKVRSLRTYVVAPAYGIATPDLLSRSLASSRSRRVRPDGNQNRVDMDAGLSGLGVEPAEVNPVSNRTNDAVTALSGERTAIDNE